jgi:arginine-tRNA-protein transferase
MKYLHWNQETVTDLSPQNITHMYQDGYLFTRINRGVMQQTRSIRINLGKFEITSENRRILKKGEDIQIEEFPIPYFHYDWHIGKMAKDFYDKKAPSSFTVNKIKELLTSNHNFNKLLKYSDTGYVITYENSHILHYCYPFYDIEKSSKDMGLIMMTKAIVEAKNKNLSYIYLGSLQRPSDAYKLQFQGIEWFDGHLWRHDIDEAKFILKNLVHTNTEENE